MVEDRGAYGSGSLNPAFGCQGEAVQAGLHSNPVEFDGIETRVVEKLDGSFL